MKAASEYFNLYWLDDGKRDHEQNSAKDETRVLGDEFVRDGGQELGLVVLAADDVGADGLLGVTSALGGGLAGSLGGLLLQLVPLHAVQEVGSGKESKSRRQTFVQLR